MFEWLFGGVSFNPETDIPSLAGKVIIVTGGNTGIGRESVLQLAKHNPKEIFLAARTPSKAEAAIAEIKNEVPNAPVSYLKLDLTSFDSIKQAAADFNARSSRLDILLNNAGIMAVPYSETKDGYEVQFGTNHMGHALLTKLLLPTMLRTAEESGSDVRIVNLSSDGHRTSFMAGGILFDQSTASSYGTWTRYGSAKLANIMHARGLRKHYPQITSVSLHPGTIQTDLFDSFSNSNFLIKMIYSWTAGLFMQTVPQGARNSLWCCTAPKQEVAKGYFIRPIGIADKGNGYAQDENLVDRCWEWTEAELKKHGF